MNLIINGFHNNLQIKILNKLVEEFDFNYIHHISCDGVFINSNSSNTIIDTSLFYIIGDGNYDFSNCPALDPGIIEEMLPYESTVIKLMDRLELYSDKGYSKYKRRYSLYLKHLRYWNHLIKSKQINLFISQNIPHEIYDYIIYALCKVYKIPVLFFFQTQMHDTVITLSDINDWQKYLLPEYKRLQQVYQSKPINSIIFSNRALLEWSIRAKEEDPFYMKKGWYGFKNSGKFFGVKLVGNKNRLKKIINPLKLIQFSYFLIKRIYQNKKLFFIYKLVSINPDYSKKYIYFPLHLQPELSTCPMGGATDNQALMVDLIAKSLPENVFLYVKENPKQTFLCRDYKFYSNILKDNKNIIFVPRSCNTHKLIKNSLAIATVTGTAGWEALFKRKPVLVFGNCFYDSAPGVFKIKSFQDCQLAIKKVIDNEFLYNEKKLKLFLKAVSNVSLNCCSDPAYFKISSLSVKENNDRLFKFLEKYFLGTIEK